MRGKRQRERQQQKDAAKQAEIQERQRIKAYRQKLSQIMETLEETQPRPKLQIERIAERIGLDFALEKLQQTEQIEAQGGMMLLDNSRRRTKGGVFFFLVKQALKEEGRKTDIKEIFYKNQNVEEQSDEESDTKKEEQEETVAS